MVLFEEVDHHRTAADHLGIAVTESSPGNS